MIKFEKVRITTNGEYKDLIFKDNKYMYEDISVSINENNEILLTGNKTPLAFIEFEMNNNLFKDALILGDAWERAYGDLEWKKADVNKIMPWYFMAYCDNTLHGIGVKTLPNSFCGWKCDNDRIVLIVDVRNGTHDIVLNGRELKTCTLVIKEYGGDIYRAARQFCREMCDNPKTPKRAIYGGNDWYCNYADNSFDKILTHTKRIVECSPKGADKPYMVIDDGWEICQRSGDREGEYFNGGPWKYANRNFGDMKKMADAVSAEGAIPGIWFRPLLTVEKIPQECVLRREGIMLVLDPSHPKALDIVKDDVKTFTEWGYRLIKHDFSSFDITKQWGFEMETDLYKEGHEVSFYDKTRTTAEIIKDFYMTLKEAAGDDVLIIGCNTFSHLSAGIFEIQRTGDDTSGLDWSRTKKYGINTLAMRMPQHEAFYAADADCVGITNSIDRRLNRQWLDVLAKSGTPLFVSIAEDAYSDEVKADITEACKKASETHNTSRPLDWLDSRVPCEWESDFGDDKYMWD